MTQSKPQLPTTVKSISLSVRWQWRFGDGRKPSLGKIYKTSLAALNKRHVCCCYIAIHMSRDPPEHKYGAWVIAAILSLIRIHSKKWSGHWYLPHEQCDIDAMHYFSLFRDTPNHDVPATYIMCPCTFDGEWHTHIHTHIHAHTHSYPYTYTLSLILRSYSPYPPPTSSKHYRSLSFINTLAISHTIKNNTCKLSYIYTQCSRHIHTHMHTLLCAQLDIIPLSCWDPQHFYEMFKTLKNLFILARSASTTISPIWYCIISLTIVSSMYVCFVSISLISYQYMFLDWGSHNNRTISWPCVDCEDGFP